METLANFHIAVPRGLGRHKRAQPDKVIGGRNGPDPDNGVARFDHPFAFGDRDDKESTIPRLRAEGKQSLAAREGSFEFLVGHTLPVVIGSVRPTSSNSSVSHRS